MIKAIVTDIEGTTSSISFVHDVLFPYAREHLADFVRGNSKEVHVAQLLDDVRREVGEELDLSAVINQLTQWIEEDKKITPLKALQGLIWEKGYKDGDFYGHIYADAYEHLKQWHERGIKLYVYSSGSVYAQKLLFGHTEYGDLTPWFDGNFDTQIGGKLESQSYQKIIEQMRFPADQILFLSDSEKELDAARLAGMQTVWLMRDGEFDSSRTHHQVADFNSIDIN